MNQLIGALVSASLIAISAFYAGYQHGKEDSSPKPGIGYLLKPGETMEIPNVGSKPIQVIVNP